jgi:two-component system OmpR family sensor kinase
VRDYGDGILPDEADQLFSRFYRSPRHRDGAIHGTGIGLALCKAIVTAHGGTIEVRNAPTSEPRGAVFTIRLPLA